MTLLTVSQVIFISLVGVTVTQGNVDWTAQICLGGNRYNISRSQCCQDQASVGIWFVDAFKIDRACFSPGVWAVYKAWCQEPRIWITGTTSKAPGCMERSILEKVVGLVFLGTESSGIVVSSTKQRLFLQLSETGTLPAVTLLDPELSVLSWGTKIPYTLEQQYENETDETCLSSGGSSFSKQYKLKVRVGQKMSLSLRSNCSKSLDKTKRPVGGTPCKMLKATTHLNPKQPTLNCSDLGSSKRSSKVNSKDDTVRTINMILRDVNEQSARLALKFHAYSFKNLVLPDQSLEQLKLLEISKTVFEQICPEAIVPQFFVETMSVLSKFLIAESIKIFPRPAMDVQTFKRIENVVQKCLTLTKSFEFEVEEPCSNNSEINLKVKFLNGTEGLAPRDLPDDIRNNIDIYDLVVEFTWKLFLFAHYTCAAHFSQYPSDLSAFYAAWHNLVTRDLRERWSNPGKSFEMLKLIFQSIDLIRAVQNLDHCVSAAHSQSVYFGWLKRPFQVKGHREIRTKDLIWDDNAYCMDHYSFPAIRLGYQIEACGVAWQAD